MADGGDSAVSSLASFQEAWHSLHRSAAERAAPKHEEPRTIAQRYPHYFRNVQHLGVVDVYRILELWGVTDPCLQHAVKKLLVTGGRGAKPAEVDVKEAIATLQRWLEMRAEDAAVRESGPEGQP